MPSQIPKLIYFCSGSLAQNFAHLYLRTVLAFCNNRVVQHGFSSFLVIHRKREGAVFSGERNASARCLPAYNSCSSSRVPVTRRQGFSLAALSPIGFGSSSLRPRWESIGQKRIESARSDSPRACHCRVRPVRNRKSARAVYCTVAQQIKNIACRRNSHLDMKKVTFK